MKKFLVMLVLVSMVASANASIVSIVGSSEINTGETLSYSVVLSDAADGIGSFDLDLGTDSVLASMGNVVVTAAGRDAGLDYVGTDFVTYDYEVSASAPYGAAISAGTLFTFDVTAGDTKGTFTFGLADLWTTAGDGSQISPTLSSLSVNVVPEPATLAILGLGGLLIRRKK